jgi:hypothetical protein
LAVSFNSFDHSPTSAYAAKGPITHLQNYIKEFRILTCGCFAEDSLIPRACSIGHASFRRTMDTNWQKPQWPRGPPLETETGSRGQIRHGVVRLPDNQKRKRAK